jgi:hypothetical protein
MNKNIPTFKAKKLVKLKFSLLVVNVKENYTTASTEGHRLATL